MHGAGIIQGLEEKMINGNPSMYYEINLPLSNMTVTISTAKVDHLGIRSVIPRDDCQFIIENTEVSLDSIPDNWNKRYEYNQEKLKTGELGKAIEVYVCLFTRERQKGLSGMEKKLLSNAKHVLLSEISISYGIDKIAAEEMLRKIVAKYDKTSV
jgi:CarD family transcriptional regulator